MNNCQSDLFNADIQHSLLVNVQKAIDLIVMSHTATPIHRRADDLIGDLLPLASRMASNEHDYDACLSHLDFVADRMCQVWNTVPVSRTGIYTSSDYALTVLDEH